MKFTSYRVGLTLLIISWIICLNPYWMIFGIPIFIVGLGYVWTSNKNNKTKAITSVIPILIWIPCVLLFQYIFSQRMSPETFLIPNNFRGQITIIYDEPCGILIKKENDRLTYHVPENGIMILKNKFETGIINQKYFLVDNKGNRIKKLNVLIQQDFNEDYTLEKNKHEPPRNEIGVFLTGTGSTNVTGHKEYKYHTINVNTWTGLKAYNAGIKNNIDSMVIDCRNRK